LVYYLTNLLDDVWLAIFGQELHTGRGKPVFVKKGKSPVSKSFQSKEDA
jgi:hypothetical protein